MKKYAFTLVELMVAITIGAILATIAFLSYSSYSSSTQKSVKMTNIKNIKKSFETYKSSGSPMPQPKDGVEITYSGKTIWTQGYFTKTLLQDEITALKEMKDTEFDTFFTYSLSHDGKNYQIGTVIDWGNNGELFGSNIINNSYAKTGNYKTYLDGNYNCGDLLKVRIGGKDNYLGVASIVASQTGTTDVVELFNNKDIVLNGSSIIPPTYDLETDSSLETFSYGGTGSSLVVYQGDSDDITSPGVLDQFAIDLNNVFAGSNLEEYKCYRNPSYVTQANFGITALFTPDPVATETITPTSTEFPWIDGSHGGAIKCKSITLTTFECDFTAIDLTQGNGSSHDGKYFYVVNGSQCGGKHTTDDQVGESINIDDCFNKFNSAGIDNEIKLRIRIGNKWKNTDESVNIPLPTFNMSSLGITLNGAGIDFLINTDTLTKDFRFYINDTICDTSYTPSSSLSSGRIDSIVEPTCGVHFDGPGDVEIKVRYNADNGDFWSDPVIVKVP